MIEELHTRRADTTVTVADAQKMSEDADPAPSAAAQANGIADLRTGCLGLSLFCHGTSVILRLLVLRTVRTARIELSEHTRLACPTAHSFSIEAKGMQNLARRCGHPP